MKRKIAFLFSGQGSQYYQMGRLMYEQNTVFRSNMDQMDRLARDMLGVSVVQTLYGPHGKAEPFDVLRLSHPAIFMVEYALAQSVMELGIRPDCTVGASLGTFAALAVAGCMTAQEALAMVIRQAQAVEAHCPKGGMVAIMASPALYEESPFLQARAVIAGRNFASHFAISAPVENLPAIEGFLNRAGVTFQALPVHFPFHSPWIERVRAELIAASGSTRFTLTGTPVICCAIGGVVREAADDFFWNVAREEISFMPAMAQLEQAGPVDYLDLGPSGTLSTFLKYLLPADSPSRRLHLMSPYGRDTDLLAAMAAQLLPASLPRAVGL